MFVLCKHFLFSHMIRERERKRGKRGTKRERTWGREKRCFVGRAWACAWPLSSSSSSSIPIRSTSPTHDLPCLRLQIDVLESCLCLCLFWAAEAGWLLALRAFSMFLVCARSRQRDRWQRKSCLGSRAVEPIMSILFFLCALKWEEEHVVNILVSDWESTRRSRVSIWILDGVKVSLWPGDRQILPALTLSLVLKMYLIHRKAPKELSMLIRVRGQGQRHLTV